MNRYTLIRSLGEQADAITRAIYELDNLAAIRTGHSDRIDEIEGELIELDRRINAEIEEVQNG